MSRIRTDRRELAAGKSALAEIPRISPPLGGLGGEIGVKITVGTDYKSAPAKLKKAGTI